MKRITCLWFSLNIFCALSQTPLEKANDCYQKKDYQCAIDNYLSALNSNSYQPGDKHILQHRIGYGYYSLKEYTKAIDFLRMAVAQKPDYWYSWWSLGDLYYNLEKYDSAIVNYQRGRDVAAKPEDKETITWWLGNAYNNANKYANAIEELKKSYIKAG